MSVNSLIADDEITLALHLQRRLQVLWPELIHSEVVNNGQAALAYLSTVQPPVAFLDIQMPGLSGLEVAARLTYPCLIVFVTAFDQYAIEAFEQAAVDYVLKPINDERLAQTIQRLRQRLEAPPALATWLPKLQTLLANQATHLRWLKVALGNEIRLISCDEICYLAAQDKYTVVCTATHEYLMRMPLKDLLPQLDPEQFWQIHRSTLVNLSAIAGVKRELTGQLKIRLKTRPEALVVSRSFAERFKQM